MTPALTISMVEPTAMLAASTFSTGSDSQTIEPSDEEYDGEFSVKSGEFLWE